MRKPILAASLTLIASLLLIPVASVAQGGGVLLINQLSGRCMDVAGDPGTENGSPLQLGDCEWSGFSPSSQATDQTWNDPGMDAAVFIQNTLSGRCIDVAGDPGTDSGLPLQLWDCEWSGFSSSNSPTDQVWVFRSDGFIQNALSGRCIDVAGDPGMDGGLPLRLWDCESLGTQTDQSWSSSIVAAAD